MSVYEQLCAMEVTDEKLDLDEVFRLIYAISERRKAEQLLQESLVVNEQNLIATAAMVETMRDSE